MLAGKKRGISKTILAMLVVIIILIAALATVLVTTRGPQPTTIVQTITQETTEVLPGTTIVRTQTLTQTTVMEKTEVVETTKVVERVVKNPDTLVLATIGAPETLDPAWAYDTASGEIIENVYETLIDFKIDSNRPPEERGRTDEFVPELATEWEVVDDTTIRFKIREGVKFHCGGTLTPEDVEYSLERLMVMDRDGGPSWMLLEALLGVQSTRDEEGNIVVPYERIDKAVEVEDGWVVLRMEKPFSRMILFQILSQSWASIVDKEWAVEQGAWPGTAETYEQYNNPETPPLNDKMCGTGPFMLEKWEPGVQTILKRFDDYWREPAKLQRVVVKVVEEWTTRKFMLLSGDADMVDVPRQFVPELEGTACEGLDKPCPTGIRYVKGLPTLVLSPALFFTLDIDPNSPYLGSGQLDGEGIPPNFFQDVRVRQAFAYAFDYDTFIKDAFLGEADRPCTPIIKGLPFYNPDAQCYTYDLEKAKELLMQAWDGQVWEKGFKITILYNTGNVARQTAAEILKKNIESLNPKFKVEIRNVDWPAYLKAMVGKQLPLFLIGWLADYPDPHNFYFPFFHSKGTFAAWQGYSNPEVDQLIEQASQESDPAKREQLYRQLDQIYFEEAISIPLAQPLARHYERDWVQGWYYSPINPGVDFYTIWKQLPEEM